MRLLLLALLCAATGCSGCKSRGPAGSTTGGGTPAPPPEQRPADLGPSGLLLDQPGAGAAVRGTWVSVSGWFDPARYRDVRVVGADLHPELYGESGGHGGLPSVPVALRSDGRFIAPRVPLAEGDTRLLVYTLPPQPDGPLELHVTGQQTGEAPATLGVEPAALSPGDTAQLTPASAQGQGDWQVDADGDGTFEATVANGQPLSARFDAPGSRWLLARRKGEAGWIYATARVVVSAPYQVLAEAAQPPAHPAALAVVPDLAAWGAAWARTGQAQGQTTHLGEVLAQLPDAGSAFTAAVLVADGDAVVAYDADLRPLRTLSGLAGPRGVAGGPSGLIYVADTGRDRVVRYLADGTLDPSFAAAGAFTGPVDGLALKAPSSLWAYEQPTRPDGGSGGYLLAVLDQGNGRVLLCKGSGLAGAPACEVVQTLQNGSDVPPGPDPVALAMAAPLSTRWERLGVYDHLDGAPGALAVRGGKQVLNSGSIAVATAAPRLPVVALTVGKVNASYLPPYTAAVLSDGSLQEWLGLTAPGRSQRLPFAAAAVALDAQASQARAQQAEARGRDSGPLVLYVAGPGHLQRLLLPPLALGGH